MANCIDCNDGTNPISLTGNFFPGSPCEENNDCAGTSTNANCVYYNGPNLSCSGILTLDSLETALQKIDEQICAISGDYTTYNMHCIPAWYGATIDTEAKFVDAITAYVCDTNTALTTFINTTYPADQSSLSDRIDSIEEPAIECASAGVTETDSLSEILTKYCEKFTDLDTFLDITGVDWNNCFTVVSPPTTLEGSLQLLADQICELSDSITNGGAFPTFSNYTNCLGGTSSDSLVETIDLIIDRLCATPTLDNDNLTSDCIPIPGTDTDLETLLQNMLDELDVLSQALPTFDATDFTVTATDPLDPCAGVTVALATSAAQDRFVASNASDASPGTLQSKVTAGSSISLDFVTTPGQMIVSLTNSDKGDITVAAGVWTIDAGVVTLAKIQNAVGNSKILGSGAAGAGTLYTELSIGSNLVFSGTTLNTYGRTLINVTKFTASGTWTKPTGCNAVMVVSIGAGGGGGGVTGTAANAAAGAGGGGGGFAVNYITSGLGATETVTIGTGGLAGAVGATGGTGGSTLFGSHVTVTGGVGGAGMTFGTAASVVLGGAPGLVSGTAGILVSQGGDYGEMGTRYSGTLSVGGQGGSSYYNGRSINTLLGVGSVGNASGGGGGGGASSTDGNDYTGGAGNNGYLIVFEYS